MGQSTSKNFEEIFDNQPPTPPPVEKRVMMQEFDPRSPSCQIIRTPIQVAKTPEVVSDPRSPTEGIDRTPIIGKTQAVADCSSPPACSGLLDDEREASQDSTGGAITSPRYNSTEDLLPNKVSMAPDGSKAVSKKKRKSKTLFKIHSTPTPKNVSPFRVKNGEINKTSNGTSSPLSSRNVDYNSPRAIVQRKQTDKLSFMSRKSTPAKYKVMDDKENIQH